MNLAKAVIPTRRAFAERMRERGADDHEFAVIECDIGYSTHSRLFGEAYPDRYFNMGIAELGAVGAAAGMAAGGRTVFVCGYGVFISMRSLEAIRSFVCYPNLNVKFLSSHAGLTASTDGVTHQATEDVAIMSTLPNMRVLAPADTSCARAAFDLALSTPGPVYVRLMRDPLLELGPPAGGFRIGGSRILRAGNDLTIAACGDIVFQALEAAEALSSDGIEAEVVDCYSMKPVDAAAVLESVRRTGSLLVAENHQRRNGLGYELGIALLKDRPAPFENLGLDDTFGESGAYASLIEKYGLSAASIAEAARGLVVKKSGTIDPRGTLRSSIYRNG
jgi:transketolase